MDTSHSNPPFTPTHTRTQQAWCQPGLASECYTHPLIDGVHDRVVNVTGVPKEHAEFYQVLRYEEGQFYKQHHDQNAAPDSLMGVRLFTFFMYLRAPVAGGGRRQRERHSRRVRTFQGGGPPR